MQSSITRTTERYSTTTRGVITLLKTLVLTVLSLVFFPSNIGTNSAQASSLKKAKQLKHEMVLSEYKINWYHGRGHWTLHASFPTCKAVERRFSERRADICYHARVTLERHAERYNRIHDLLYPQPVYETGPYDWDSLVSKCEAKSSGWYANTGNGFFFGPQFTPSTWHSSGGGPVLEIDGHGPSMRSYSIPYIKHIAYRTMQLQGSGAWPNCNGFLY